METRSAAPSPDRPLPGSPLLRVDSCFFISWHLTMRTKLLGRWHKRNSSRKPQMLTQLQGCKETLSLESVHRVCNCKSHLQQTNFDRSSSECYLAHSTFSRSRWPQCKIARKQTNYFSKSPGK
jgi:hypothetical protein